MTLPIRIMRTVLWLWALPLTLCGLPLWLLMAGTHQRSGQKNIPNQAVAYVKRAQAATVFVAYGAPTAWLLKRHPFGEMDAIAVGCCIFAQNEVALARTMAHEMVHVRQALHWGALFPLAYLLCSVWAQWRGQCPYAGNYFECQANQPRE
jgi:hypothetical protein